MKERFDFEKGKLDENNLPNSPFELFSHWKSIAAKEVSEYNAMILSTALFNGEISSRIVYLREIIDNKLIFYTNYNSQKGVEIIDNQNVSLLFFWKELEQQIRIQGTIEKTSDIISDNYFKGRPRGSQIGAWASEQSSEIDSRAILENRCVEFENKFKGKAIPRPKHWGGYSIKPTKFEFWQGRKSRLHDRIVYKMGIEKWTTSRLAP